jgi:hypothetical protein
VAAFCRERKLRASHFYWWKKRLREKTTARFVEVRVEDSRTNLPVDSRIEVLWFAKISAGTKNRSGPGRVGLYTIIARYGMKTKTLKGTNPSARSAHI